MSDEDEDDCGGCGHNPHAGRCFKVIAAKQGYGQCNCAWRNGKKGRRRKP